MSRSKYGVSNPTAKRVGAKIKIDYTMGTFPGLSKVIRALNDEEVYVGEYPQVRITELVDAWAKMPEYAMMGHYLMREIMSNYFELRRGVRHFRNAMDTFGDPDVMADRSFSNEED